MSIAPGLLCVTMQPTPGLSLDQFHEWYNNEHGPTRLRLPAIFSNGLRYQATDGLQPAFLAAYDVTAMSHLETETYTALRANRSPREGETIGRVDVARYLYDLVHTSQSLLFKPIERLTDEEAEGLVTVAVEITPTDAPGAGDEYQKWYIEEHVGLLAKVPGWLRSRFYKTSSIESGQAAIKYFALHDYTRENGLGGDLHKASMNTPRRSKVFEEYIASKHRRTYSLFYVFGPAPRDLYPLSRLPPDASFKSQDERTVTTAGPDAKIDSYITTSDALAIPYRLEGNPSPSAPCVAFSNSLLTSLHMWDPFIRILKEHRPDLKILRYDFRGRNAIPHPGTLNLVTDDLKLILDALRITKLHALIGVSMGGVTTLNFALQHPSRLRKFIACDFNCTSSPANTQAWKDRVAVAEADSGRGIKTLAEQTVSRWFHPKSMGKPETVRWITDMVAANDVGGFKNSCTVLWDYDLKPKMKSCTVPGLLVVGSDDAKGAVVKAMDGFKSILSEDGTELRLVPETGHLPMCEDPQAFWETVKDFI
ncbi:3-oxoadipate enol-lactonase 2-like protein [Cladobotryum mycophilum]|uniref:3-oxoadipate enol-lactonase 2-like protein n=1 Tax=Cladobotryum mycophilum TaxID=491253 RepID=A0ABR0T185_9HYPO